MKIINDQVCAIIPARSGSKGVKNKNIYPIQGFPMIAYSIAAAKLSQTISRVLVSTDSEEYAEIARSFGAEAPFIRPQILATDTSSDLEFMEHLIEWLDIHEGALPEYFVHLRPTNPFRDPKIIDQAVEKMASDKSATSLRSAHLSENSPYKWFKINDAGYFSSIIEGQTNDEANQARQAFPAVYIPDGYVDVLRTQFIASSHLMHGERMIAFQLPSNIDVDSYSDLNRILESYQQIKEFDTLYQFLKSNYSAQELAP